MIQITEAQRSVLDAVLDTANSPDTLGAIQAVKAAFGVGEYRLYIARWDDSEEIKGLAKSRLLYDDGNKFLIRNN